MRLITSIQILAVGFITLFSSCHRDEPIEKPFDPLLLNCWTHSFEEVGPYPLKVFRPCTFKEWPTSEYRETFILNDNFKATYLVRAPNDANHFEEGTWKYNKDSKLLQIFIQAGTIVIEYTIEDLQADKLILKK